MRIALGKNFLKRALVIFLLIAAVGLWAMGNRASSKFATTNVEISSEEAKKLVDSGAILLDVRTESEYTEYHIPGALFLPYDEITAQSAANSIKTFETPVVVYCRSGRRSEIAAKALVSLGYTQVRDLGSITNWKK